MSERSSIRIIKKGVALAAAASIGGAFYGVSGNDGSSPNQGRQEKLARGAVPVEAKLDSKVKVHLLNGSLIELTAGRLVSAECVESPAPGGLQVMIESGPHKNQQALQVPSNDLVNINDPYGAEPHHEDPFGALRAC